MVAAADSTAWFNWKPSRRLAENQQGSVEWRNVPIRQQQVSSWQQTGLPRCEASPHDRLGMPAAIWASADETGADCPSRLSHNERFDECAKLVQECQLKHPFVRRRLECDQSFALAIARH